MVLLDAPARRPRTAATGPVQPVAATALTPGVAARVDGGLLGDLQQHNGDVSIPGGHQHLVDEQAWANFTDVAGARQGGEHHGPVFEDGEVFKWLEAVAWEQGRRPRPELLGWLRHYADVVAAAQAEDGYLSTFNQVRGVRGRYEWISYDHEIFNMATLLQAAVACWRTTGETGLLAVARRAADHLDATFGWGRREETCGHPLVEMALVELYRATGERRYLELAGFFVDVRGHGRLHDPTHQNWESTYFSDRVPVRQAVRPEGHAVRAVYLAAGATDVAVETGDAELLQAVRGQWEAMVDSLTYVNGSLGARWEGESFGEPHELPNDRGYGETCAAIASIQWSWRLLLATGEARYADLIERQLYNAVLSGVSLGGDAYFYVNALQVRAGANPYDSRMPASGRHPWFGCSCCPTNLMRTLASWQRYLATSTEHGLQIHQYGAGELGDGRLRVSMASDYPWDGRIELTVLEAPDADHELSLRIPAWADGAEVSSPAGTERPAAGGYWRSTRRWQSGESLVLLLPMAPRFTRPHPRVDAARGCLALERGPLVYAVEQVDQPEGLLVDDVVLASREHREQRVPELGGVVVVDLEARAPDGGVLPLRAIPYFRWANREVGPMRVWLPEPAA